MGSGGGYRPQGPLALLSQIIFNKNNHVLFIVPCAGALLPSKHARAFFLLGSGRCSGHMLAAEAGEPPFSAEVERRRLEGDAGMEPLPVAGRFIICKSFEADARGGAHAALRLSSLLFREIGERQFSTIRALYARCNLHENKNIFFFQPLIGHNYFPAECDTLQEGRPVYPQTRAADKGISQWSRRTDATSISHNNSVHSKS